MRLRFAPHIKKGVEKRPHLPHSSDLLVIEKESGLKSCGKKSLINQIEEWDGEIRLRQKNTYICIEQERNPFRKVQCKYKV